MRQCAVLFCLLFTAPLHAQQQTCRGRTRHRTLLRKARPAPCNERFLDGAKTLQEWRGDCRGCGREYLDMLGLWPLPEKTPLKATVTGTLERGDVVDREAALPEPAGPVRHRQPVPAEGDRQASCRRSSTSAATPAAAATATRPRFRITACGSPTTATSA